jgi:hypothetical protein
VQKPSANPDHLREKLKKKFSQMKWDDDENDDWGLSSDGASSVASN